jgi:ribosomal protein S18 acetylase RimI-like enzyme
MDIQYKRTKEFSSGQLEQLFLSVGWQSGKHPDKLVVAFRNSTRVISAWDNDKLVGLIRGLDDGIWQATIDCLLVHKDYQCLGIASTLLEMLKVDYIDMFYLDVIPDEKGNVKFYQKHGFRIMLEGTAMQIVGSTWNT